MCMYGYARVSTKSQSIAMQTDAIKRFAPDAKIYSESFTGSTLNRPEWNKLYKVLKPGDTVIFWAVDRMSRDDPDSAVALYMELYNKGINLIFLNNRTIDTDVYRRASANKIESVSAKSGNAAIDKFIPAQLELINTLIADLAAEQIRKAFDQAHTELNHIHERTRAGMAAKEAGRKISEARTGKTYETIKSLEAKRIIAKYSNSFGGTAKDTECMQFANVSRNTYYKFKAELVAMVEEKQLTQAQLIKELDAAIAKKTAK